MKFLDRKNLNKVILGVITVVVTVIAVIVVTTIYSGVEYFIQNWNCLWDE